MRYQPGTSGNLNGRPKGKKKKQVKPLIEKLLENTLPLIERDLKNNPGARISFFMDLTRIVLTVKN